MYAIVEINGHQFKVEQGRKLFVDRLRNAESGQTVEFDKVLLIDAAARDGRYGTQRFLSFFLKSPQHDYTQDEMPENNLFRQYTNLKNAIREMGGYEADETID